MITGGDGDDTLTGNADDDTFNVSAGEDTITDLGGCDELNVTCGTATATVTADFTATSETDNDATYNTDVTLELEDGIDADLNSASTSSAGYTVTADGNTSASTIVGSDDDDVLTGGEGDDTITGGDGDNTIDAGDGDDTIKFTGSLIEANDSNSNTIDGGADTDTLEITDQTTGMEDADLSNLTNMETLQLADEENTVVLGSNAETAGFETVNGGSDVDNVTLNNSITQFTGNGGADEITLLADEDGGLTIENSDDSTLNLYAFLDTETSWSEAGDAGTVDSDGDFYLDGETLSVWNEVLDTPEKVEITLTGIQDVTDDTDGALNLDFTA